MYPMDRIQQKHARQIDLLENLTAVIQDYPNPACIRDETGKFIFCNMNRPGFPGECFICELRLPDHRFRWKHNKLFLLLPEEYGPAFPAIVDCYTSPPT